MGRGTAAAKTKRVKQFVKSLMEDDYSWIAMQEDIKNKTKQK